MAFTFFNWQKMLNSFSDLFIETVMQQRRC